LNVGSEILRKLATLLLARAGRCICDFYKLYHPFGNW
jgi:hypothetical protein